MRRDGTKVEIDLDLLTAVSPFILATDENMVVTWASRAVLKRVQEAVGINVSELIEYVDPPEEVSSQVIAKKIGQLCKFALFQGKSAIPLVGRWLFCREGFLLLATPDAKTSEDLPLFSFDDFPPEGHLIEMLASQDEMRASLEEATSVVNVLKERNAEIERSEQELSQKMGELNDQRRATLNIMKDIEESKRQVELANRALKSEIAERKRAEKALRESENRYSTLFKNASQAIYVAQDEKIKFPNPKTEELYGYSAEELTSKPFIYFIHEEDKKMVLERHKKRLRGAVIPSIYPFRIINKAGDTRWVEINVVSFSWDGSPATLCFLTDITERKRAEEELERTMEELVRSNVELEQFAYVASHDLREPLRKVASYTEMLARRYEGKLDSKADKFIGYIMDGTARMQGLINDLLKYSRVGRDGDSSEPTNFEDVMDRVISDLEAAIQENGAVVTHDPLPTVMGNASQMAQLFQNLIGNAIKFRGEEPPHIHVSAEQANGEWVFSVRDNGIGIEPQYAERIFAIFQRLHTRAEYPGTGIGLAICKKIVESHGGRIWVESQPGNGTTFSFTIPQKTQ